MTCTEPLPKAERTTPGTVDTGRRKAVLFCQLCGHESPVDGDWRVTREVRSETVRCPVCDHVLEFR